MTPDGVIDNEQALAEFRATRFSAGALAPAVLAHPVTLVSAAIGMGKSTLLDDLVDLFRAQGAFDLIVVLVALTANLRERRLLRQPDPAVLCLRPRPRANCGPLDAAWRLHERQGTTAFAKEHLCRSCPKFAGCFWPRQYGEALRGAQVVLGTHQHLLVNSRFLVHLRALTGARRVLLLLDEAGALAAPFRVRLAADVLARFIRAVRWAHLPPRVRTRWAEQVGLLAQARTADLQAPDWSFPLPAPREALAIQEAGLAEDPGFRWPGYELYAFARARPERRWRDYHGNIVFVNTPYLANRTVLFSAGMEPAYAARQLGVPEVTAPFRGVRCQHRQSRFYNLCSLLGAAARFRGNHVQILDVFALLILRNVHQGRLTLLVTRKRFKRLCADYLTRRLAGWGQPVSVGPSDGEPPEQVCPTALPLIHYGVNGVNSFEAYDAAYCLSGFYCDEDDLRRAIADVEDDGLRFPVSIRLAGRPRRRVAGSFDERFRASDADRIAQLYYHQLETSTVLQAVGRVRFATRPREVITFQCSELPGVQLTREFYTLRELRVHFGLPTGSEHDRLLQQAEARRLRAEGLTTREIAARLGVSERTVRHRLHPPQQGEHHG
jgi:hypothetical protein